MNHDGTTNTTEDGDAGEQQRWIDELLRSHEAAELEAAPTTSYASIATAIVKQRRRQLARRSLAGLAAATIATMLAWPSAPLPRTEGMGEELRTSPSVETRTIEASSENPSPSPSLPGRGIFLTGVDAIAMELESESPDVTVVEVLPTVSAEHQLHRELALQDESFEPFGG